MLENIKSPADIKGLDNKECAALAKEIRKEIIYTVAKNGGHLASNLGIVEATIALHRLFDSPRDSIIFDVSHQSYAHKLLTGRYESFKTLRQSGGISGFTNRDESEHDLFTFGHSGSAVSAALGMAEANKLKGSDAYTVAVVGDASFSNGMVFEALNCITDKDLRLIIVLNDNGMSISKNRGRLANHFSRLRTSRRYLRLKNRTEKFLGALPLVGKPLTSLIKSAKHLLRFVIYKDNLFTGMGIDYIGPADGNDMENLEAVLSEAKRRNTVSVVHIITKKGLGYPPAVWDSEAYHSVAPFDVARGVTASGGRQFSDVFGDIMKKRAEEDLDLAAVCAAMCSGTGLSDFAKEFPDRYFDVGIGEEHAVTFACGLARAGLKPVAAIYSTFIQRTFDQLVQDASLQKLPLVLALDRAGLVPGDGATHHGVLDCAMLSCVPGMHIWSPESYADMEYAFEKAFSSNLLSAVRYPRGCEEVYESSFVSMGDMSVSGSDNARAVIITYGRVAKNAVLAADIVGGVKVVKLIKVFPLDVQAVMEQINGAGLVYFLEESMDCGCLSRRYAEKLAENGVKVRIVVRNLGSDYMPHGSLEYLYEKAGFLPSQIAREITEALNS